MTVLFADLVDSTGLAQRLDPERAREVLGGFFDAASEELRALRGHAEKFIGDAVMAVFGLPHVHEDDAVRAVRAGLAIRDRMHRLQESLGLDEPLEVRVGIETGEAATGVGPTGQLLVTGQVVNAAARLQTAGQPGEVLVGATTYALTTDAVSFGTKQEVEAKGFVDALPAYPVEALTTRSSRRTIPFVGRSYELDILRGSIARVEATSSPLLVSILGEPGVGKSRLADELLAGLGSDVTVLQGRAHAYGDTATFAPVTAIVREIAGIEDEMAPDEAMRRLQEVVDGCCDPSEAERVAGRLGLTIGLGAPKREESVFVQDVQSGFLSLVEGLSGRGPVVLVFEDVHRLHPPMLDLIERVAATTRKAPQRALTIALGRPELLEERPSWGSGVANAVTLRLDPLPDDEALELVREAAGGRVHDDEAAEIASRTGGNPFFIVETTGMVLRARQDGAASSGRALPPTVQAVVAARLDSLRHRLRDLARRASVFIYSFDLEELATASDADIEDIRGLEDAEILVREEAGRAPRWRFRHETVREVAYASLPKRERLSLHEGIADALMESGHRSYAADHLERAAQASIDLDPADRRVPDRAVDALIMAGIALADAWRASRRWSTTSERSRWPDRRAHGRRARPEPWRGWGRRTTGWASTRRRARRSRAPSSSGRSSTTRGRSRSPSGTKATSRSTWTGTSTKPSSSSATRSPRPESSTTPGRCRGRCSSRGGCRGRERTTRKRTRSGSGRSRWPRSTTTRGRTSGR